MPPAAGSIIEAPIVVALEPLPVASAADVTAARRDSGHLAITADHSSDELDDDAASPVIRHPILAEITLRQLHRRSKAPHRALHIVSASQAPAPQAPVDAETAQLSGRAYLEFLVTDTRPGKRLPSEMIMLISGDQFLESQRRNDENLVEIAEKLRPVVAEMYRDRTLSAAVADHVINTSERCTDGGDYDLRQIQDMALAAKISRGGMDDIALYNHGLSFFMLDQVEKETGREITRRYGDISVREALHDHMYAVLYLQDKLQFPNRQQDPRFQSAGFMTRAIAEEIGERVCRSAVEKGGEKFFDFMSKWDPWIAHLKRQPMFEPRFEKNAATFHKWLNKHEQNCDIAGSPENRMTEQQRINKVNTIREKYIEWDKDLVAQLTRDFLFNHRAFYLSYLNELPAYFETGQNIHARHDEVGVPANEGASSSPPASR